MHLISELACGLNGAESGTAYVYKRGTQTPAVTYDDFEGAGGASARLDLDAYGARVCYVDELVDVFVYTSSGGLLRTFTPAVAASAVEVRSQGFTGTAYDTAVSAPGNPTTLKSLLDLLYTSAGAVDFNVAAGGSTTTLSGLAALYGRVFNVRDPVYGAVGSGAVDDYAAVQSAINAADSASAGVVYFPPGVYLCNTQIEVPANVRLVGSGAAVTELRSGILTGAAIVVADAGTVYAQDLTFGLSSAMTGPLDMWRFTAATATSAVFERCTFGSALRPVDTAVDGSSSTGTVKLVDCTAYVDGAASTGYVVRGPSLARVELLGGSVAQGSLGIDSVVLASGAVTVNRVAFEFGAVVAPYIVDGSGTLAGAVVVSDIEVVSSGSTVTVVRTAGATGGSWAVRVANVASNGFAIYAFGDSTYVREGSSAVGTHGIRDATGTGTALAGARHLDLDIYRKTDTAGLTYTIPTTYCVKGRRYTVLLEAQAGSFTVTWAGSVKPIAASQAVGADDCRAFDFVFDGTYWVAVGQDADTA